ncbi:trypsin-like peptidase domain-containing protein [Streptomyces sp. NPDC048210]|uniref:VMAP-C domain-containing protein n=1 Tax=unclassified Streptomyces TaxID=2593676 RepID=UPI002E7642C1|nr:trypsin-like peptidase domain-containing protein [Streptomyces sp. JV181]MEE1775543.1 trypsin-like peptidase domain-containing protein [Streptomyces sp. JV181]
MSSPSVQTVVIMDSVGRVTGSGFLLTRTLVLTCAHVVADALGATPSGERPRGEVQVGLTGLVKDFRAEVLAGGWLPLRDGERGDLAVLSFLGPAAHSITPPRFAPARPGSAVRLNQFDQFDRSLWQWHGVVRDTPAEGGPGQWARLEFLRGAPPSGASGSPVLDSRTGAVLGILMASGPDHPRATGWMLPVHEALDHVPVWRPRLDRRGLTAREAGALAEALLGTTVLSDPEAVDLLIRLVAALAPHIGAAIPRSRHVRPQLMVLVMTCARYADGLRTLSNAVEMLSPSSVELEAFTALVEQVTAQPLLLPDERRSLHELLARVAAPARVSPGHGDADALVERAVELENASTTEGEPPALLAFVSGVAEQAVPEVRLPLRLWIREVGQRLGIDVTPVDETPKRPGGPAVLKYTLTETAWEAGRYEVYASLLPSPQEDPRPLGGSEGPIPLAAVEELVRDTLQEATRLLGPHSDRLRIEFELPRRLLELDVEAWSADGAEEGGRIGRLHPVTVRLGGRTAIGRHERRARWEALVTRPNTLSSRWVEGSGLRVLCMDPRIELSPSAQQPLDTALAAGVPVALWTRNGAAESEARIEELVEHTDLATLPEAVLDLRRRSKAAWEDGIILLYDDPRSAAPEPPLLDPFPMS